MMSSTSVEDLIKDIPLNLLDQECSRRYLASLSKRLKNWKLLSPYLDMTEVEEHSISESSRDYDEQKQSLLFKWKEKVRTSATYRVLIKAIYCSEDINLAEHACQLLQTHDEASSGACVAASVTPPSLLEYKDKLKNVYQGFINPVVVGDWPPPPTHKYIKLVLIPKERVQRGGIDNRKIYASISGNVTGDSAQTKEVDLEELLKPGNWQMILFEGSSGSGKSTLLWHICQKWQSGELFQQFTLVLLVQLRDKAVHEAKCLAEILPFSPSRTSKAAQVRKRYAEGIEDIQGEGVLILLDGWDEALAKVKQKDSLIYDLITTPYECSIDKAVVVVTSRPHACRDLREFSTSRVELQGFTKSNREMYIREVLQPDIAQKFIEEIDILDGVIDLGHPLNIVNLTHIYSASSHTLPTSPCRISIKNLLCYLLRHIWKVSGSKTPEALNSLDDLPQPIHKSFQALCKIAYDGIVNEKYSFTADELKKVPVFPSTNPSEIETLSLLQTKHSLIASGSSTHYHFLHLSFQELCATYHVVRLPEPELTHKKALEEICRTFFKQSEVSEYISFESVCNYYSAMTKLVNLKVAGQIKQIYFLYDLFVAQYESSTCSSDGEGPSQNEHSDTESNSSLRTEHSDLDSESEMEVSVVTQVSEEDFLESHDKNYFAVTSTGQYRYSSFLEFLMESQNADFVNEEIGKEMRMWVCDDDIGVLPAVVQMCPSLESVTCYGFCGTMGAALSHKKHLTQFVVKMFDRIDDFKDFQSVLNVLQTCPKIRTLNIEVHFSESVADLAADKLAKVLQKMSLESCTINGHNSLQDGAIAALAPALGGISTVTIHCEKIGSLGLNGFAVTFSPNTSLMYLHIRVQSYEGDDKIFFGSLKSAPSLRAIQLSCTGSGPPSITNTSVGRALLSGNLKELASILRLTSPPYVEKSMTIDIFEELFTEVDFKNQIFVSLGPVCWRNKYYYGRKQKEVRSKIGSTELEALSKSLKEVQVSNLYLHGHTLGDNGARSLGEALRKTCIQELIIRDCGIGVEGITQLFAGLTENTTLVSLDASFNPFGDNGAGMVATFINKTSIEVLDISNCDVRENGIVAIASALLTNTKLRRINLYSPEVISRNSEIELAKLLIKNTTLKVLHINQNPILTPLSVFISSHSRFYVSHSSTCELMGSYDTNIFYHGLKMSSFIASIEIPKASSLGLALWKHKMDDAVDILKLKQLPFGERRMKLCMSGNTWTIDYVCGNIEERDAGLKRVRDTYFSNPEGWAQLKELNLGNQILGNLGACLLAELLNQTQLQELNIACCGIGEEGIISLASALSTNTTIKHLAIGANKISKQGQNALVESFSKNVTLVSLDITGKDSTQSMRREYITSLVEDEDEDDFIHKIDGLELSSLTKVIFDSNTALGRSLEEIHLQVNERSCYHTIECQLKPIQVTKIYHRTNPSRVLYHCTA